MGQAKPAKVKEHTYPILVINGYTQKEFQIFVKAPNLETAYEWVIRKFPPPTYKHYAQTTRK